MKKRIAVLIGAALLAASSFALPGLSTTATHQSPACCGHCVPGSMTHCPMAKK